MKTILRNSVTGLYYEGVADWTQHLEEAFDFQRPERLVRFVRAAGLNPEQLELIFAFKDPRYNLSLAIDERFGVGRVASGKKRGMKRPVFLPALAGPPSAVAGSRRGAPTIRPPISAVI